MRFLVRLGYGLAAAGFAWLAWAAIAGSPPFAEIRPGDAGEHIRLAIVLAVNAGLLALFALKPGVWARVIAPVLGAAWIFVGYMMWSVARSIGELAAAVAAPFGIVPGASADTPLPALLVAVLSLAGLVLAAAALDWLRACCGAIFRPRTPAAA